MLGGGEKAVQLCGVYGIFRTGARETCLDEADGGRTALLDGDCDRSRPPAPAPAPARRRARARQAPDNLGQRTDLRKIFTLRATRRRGAEGQHERGKEVVKRTVTNRETARREEGKDRTKQRVEGRQWQ